MWRWRRERNSPTAQIPRLRVLIGSAPVSVVPPMPLDLPIAEKLGGRQTYVSSFACLGRRAPARTRVADGASRCLRAPGEGHPGLRAAACRPGGLRAQSVYSTGPRDPTEPDVRAPAELAPLQFSRSGLGLRSALPRPPSLRVRASPPLRPLPLFPSLSPTTTGGEKGREPGAGHGSATRPTSTKPGVASLQPSPRRTRSTPRRWRSGRTSSAKRSSGTRQGRARGGTQAPARRVALKDCPVAVGDVLGAKSLRGPGPRPDAPYGLQDGPKRTGAIDTRR
jgi:hypothetical protein